MQTLQIILTIIELALLCYLGIAAFYYFLFAVASLFYKEKLNEKGTKIYDIIILIPAYKEDQVIIETAKSAMEHVSTRSRFKVIVIADSLNTETISEIAKTGANVLPVYFEKSTKVKSMNRAFQVISGRYDYVIVLDADNIMKYGFIDMLIGKLEHGFQIIQGHRTAKNSNTNFAVLDGLSEEVNNAIFRKGHRLFGLSASLIGSGFICGFSLFKELLAKAKAIGGFDKEMELMLLERKIRIAYHHNAIVYDEKIQYPEAFVNQRRRWLSAQLIYCGKNFSNGIIQLIKHRNVDYFDKVVQFMLPPRIITLGITYAISFCYILLFLILSTDNVSVLFYCWLCLSFISSLAIIISIPAKMYGIGLLKSLLSLPKGFLLILLALFKVKGANKKFIHTSHGIRDN